MKRRVLQHFGIAEKPLFVNGIFSMYSQDVRNAVMDNEMIALVGPTGAGKTELYKHACLHLKTNPDQAPIFVRVCNKNKERLTIASIINAIIYDISDEGPRHDMEARSRQVVRLLGEKVVREKKHVCVVIEEAHRLHANTYRAIKELREESFAGVTPLFSIVLIGQQALEMKLF